MAGSTRVGPLSSKLAHISEAERKKRLKAMNALDKAIMQGKTLPSKNKNPERYLDK